MDGRIAETCVVTENIVREGQYKSANTTNARFGAKTGSFSNTILLLGASKTCAVMNVIHLENVMRIHCENANFKVAVCERNHGVTSPQIQRKVTVATTCAAMNVTSTKAVRLSKWQETFQDARRENAQSCGKTSVKASHETVK